MGMPFGLRYTPPGRMVECLVGRDALEQHFWLPIGASDTRLLRTLSKAHRRIMAAAERKALKFASDSVALHPADFDR